MQKILISVFVLLMYFVFGQTTQPIKDQRIATGYNLPLKKILTAKMWNELFPNRYNLKDKDVKKRTDFYSYNAFLEASSHFPKFLTEGNTEDQKRELAAFLANISQETSGGWAEAPGGYFKWGLYFLEENNRANSYIDSTKINYPPVVGKKYYGRGPKQISWNYNYGQFSESWYGDKSILLQDPDLIAKDNRLAFASALWFWMTPQYPKPSCHDVMIGNWKPNENDIAKGRDVGFGATVNIINGGLECGQQNEQQKTLYRYQYYQYFCKFLKIDPGKNISCQNQIPFGKLTI